MSRMADLDILVREANDIPEDEDTKEWCKKHHKDYNDEIFKAFSRSKIIERNLKQCRT